MTNPRPSDVFTLHRGSRPLLVSVPHAGTEIPPDVAARLVPRALAVEDADWHLQRLYAFAVSLGAGLIVPRYARYVVDLNRPPENTPMYPGRNNTELLPTRFFTGEPLVRDDAVPDAAEVERRVARYWRPYHDAVQAELERLRAEHGHAVLFDGHSIQPELPWLFEGRLPELNLGTVDGTSCALSLRDRLAERLAAQSRFSHVVDGRFKGGYITRRYGRPADGLHAVQMEMTWDCYCADAPGGAGPVPPQGARAAAPGASGFAGRAPAWDERRAAEAQALLGDLAETMLGWRP